MVEDLPLKDKTEKSLLIGTVPNIIVENLRDG